jgi:hypothetical protein
MAGSVSQPDSAGASATLRVKDVFGQIATRLRPWWPAFGFLAAFAYLDALANARYPGPEPPFWYLVPSLDILVLLGVLAVFGHFQRKVPTAFSVGALVLLLLVRLVRFGDGVSTRFFDRPFNLYIQLPLVPELRRLASDSMSTAEIVLGTGAIVFGALLGGFAAVRALRHAEAFLSRATGRRTFLSAALALSVASAVVSKPKDGSGPFGVFASSGVARLLKEVHFLARVPGIGKERAALVEDTRARLTSAPHDLSKLEKNDVLLFLVESYGECVIRSSTQAAHLFPIFDAFERDLGARGLFIASGILDSPTFGGQSWFAHATLSSGVKTSDQLEYRLIGEADPPALAAFFRAAGYRTVLVQPATLNPTPVLDYLGFERQYLRSDLGYRGPPIGWGAVPDEYTIHVVHQREFEQAGPPRFVEYALVTSHAPWSALPPIVGNDAELGDGSVYARLPIERQATRWTDFDGASVAFAKAIAYDLEVLRRYILERVKGDALVILLGDHQPPGGATEGSTARGALVHVISRRADFVDAFRRRGYTPGMRPLAAPPYPGLETFLPAFLADFSLMKLDSSVQERARQGL